MVLNKIGSNETVINFASGLEVFFSYGTPVAGRRFKNGEVQIFKTDLKWSRATTKHINNYLKSFNAEAVELPQSEIETLVGK